jgi:hypothetical protein
LVDHDVVHRIWTANDKKRRFGLLDNCDTSNNGNIYEQNDIDRKDHSENLEETGIAQNRLVNSTVLILFDDEMLEGHSDWLLLQQQIALKISMKLSSEGLSPKYLLEYQIKWEENG